MPNSLAYTYLYRTNKCTRSTQTSYLFLSEVITMLNGMTKHEDKEHGKTLKHEAPHKPTQNKNNAGTIALER